MKFFTTQCFKFFYFQIMTHVFAIKFLSQKMNILVDVQKENIYYAWKN
jgi:hypothetical protein